MLEYIDHATPRDKEYIAALEMHGSYKKAADALGVSSGTIWNAMQTLKRRAERNKDPQIPDGQKLAGTSTLYKDGEAVMQWVKTKEDADRTLEILKDAAQALSEDIKPQNPISAPSSTMPELANLYTITDAHVGALCWRQENLDPNGDWDLTIAESTLAKCFDHMVNASPPAKTGIIAQLGDYLHLDSLQAMTPTSGHLLDVDGRYPKVVQVAIRILRRLVNIALAKHENVVLVLLEGNHDLSASVWLREMFKALYENEPRITVIDSVMPYYVYQHGETMLGWHHGHLKKNDSLPLLYAAQFPKVWGNTVKRYIHTGHRHHQEIKEHSGVTVEQHSTLVARDAYASRGGWFSDRQAVAITYHSKFGQVARNVVTPEMVA